MSNASLSILNIIYNKESLFYTKIHLKFEVLRYIEQLSAVHMPQIWCYNIVPMHHLQCRGVILPSITSKNMCAV